MAHLKLPKFEVIPVTVESTAAFVAEIQALLQQVDLDDVSTMVERKYTAKEYDGHPLEERLACSSYGIVFNHIRDHQSVQLVIQEVSGDEEKPIDRSIL